MEAGENQPAARFEFRVFGHCFDQAEQQLRMMAQCDSITESRELYVLDREHIDERNLKIRGGALEYKQLVERLDDLQRWMPAGQWVFPVAAVTLREVFGPTMVPKPAALRDTLTRAELLEQVRRPGSLLYRAAIFKRRFLFSPSACRTEVDQLLVNGAAIQSLAIEAEDPQAVLALRAELGLDGRENVAYPRAIARIMGLLPLPDEDDYG